MSVASNKARRWRRKLWRVEERRRRAGLPPAPSTERVLFEAKKKRNKIPIPRRIEIENLQIRRPTWPNR